VAQGRIGRFGDKLTIKTELYNSKSGNLIASFTGSSKNIDDLLSLIDEKAPILFKKLPDVSNDISDLEKAVDYELDSEKDYFAKEKPYAATPEFEQLGKTSFWVAIGLDVLGVAFISFAVYENSEMNKAYEKYNRNWGSSEYYENAWKDAESSRKTRNALYVIGGVFLASGIGVHIWF
jgi:hypothetical protein